MPSTLLCPPGDATQQMLSLDSKTLRRSFDVAAGQTALHVLCVFATESQTVLASRKSAGKKSELQTLKVLLGELDLQGRTVTIDAAGCQSSVASEIATGGGDYVLTLKGNQKRLHTDAAQRFAFAERCGYQATRTGKPLAHTGEQQIEKGHGRIEQRRIEVLSTEGAWFDPHRKKWSSAQSVVRITAHVQPQQMRRGRG